MIELAIGIVIGLALPYVARWALAVAQAISSALKGADWRLAAQARRNAMEAAAEAGEPVPAEAMTALRGGQYVAVAVELPTGRVRAYALGNEAGGYASGVVAERDGDPIAKGQTVLIRLLWPASSRVAAEAMRIESPPQIR